MSETPDEVQESLDPEVFEADEQVVDEEPSEVTGEYQDVDEQDLPDEELVQEGTEVSDK